MLYVYLLTSVSIEHPSLRISYVLPHETFTKRSFLRYKCSELWGDRESLEMQPLSQCLVLWSQMSKGAPCYYNANAMGCRDCRYNQ